MWRYHQRHCALRMTDPLLFRKYKATKRVREGHVSFDDRAYVKLKIKKD